MVQIEQHQVQIHWGSALFYVKKQMEVLYNLKKKELYDRERI